MALNAKINSRFLQIVGISVALVIAFPILVVAANLFKDTEGTWAHLVEYKLSGYVTNSLLLAIGTGAVSILLGVPSAWIITFYKFPGKKIFAWALLLPLAMPAYLMAYTYTDLLEYSGPLQSALREWFGWSKRDYYFPEIRSLGGAILMMGFVLYPYVYLLSRAGFIEQSIGLLEAGQTLGKTRRTCFWRVALPGARPAIAGGVALAMMETLADFGTVDYFAVDTFTTGIYRTWFGLGSPVAAGNLAAVLLLFAITILFFERRSRKSKRFHNANKQAVIPQWETSKAKQILFITVCLFPLMVGFFIPTGVLANYAWHNVTSEALEYLSSPAWNSFSLALLTSGILVAIGIFLAYNARINTSLSVRVSTRLASLGYAIPGSVIAIGILIPLASFDNQLSAFMEKNFDIKTGLLLTGSIFGLIFAYVVRFLTVSFNTIESGLGKINPNMDWAGRALGKSPLAIARKIHAPLLKSSLFTACLLAFVEVLKELPATMIVRPFNFETLAVRVYNLASDERIEEAALPALAIVVTGLLPIIILSRLIRKSKTTQS